MTSSTDAQSPPQARRPFAAKYEHKGWGLGLTIFGGLGIFAGISSLVSPTTTTESDPVGSFIVALASLALGIYLLRGRGVDPKIAARRAAAEQRQAALAAEGMEQATRALAAARGGAAVVAYRNLEATVQRFHPQDAAAKLHEALAFINFDPSRLNSPRFGMVHSTNGGAVEVFRDWIIYGQESHDVDASTRGNVYVDGAVRVSAVPVAGTKTVVNQTQDLRTAQLQFVSASWSMSVPINPDQANEARRLVGQLAVNVELLKPRGVTAAEMSAMVNTILNSTGQPPAEKLKQLSNLRFERLLSDEEFEAAKARILGI